MEGGGVEWSDGGRGREGRGCSVKGEWYSHIVVRSRWWVVVFVCEVGGRFHMWVVVFVCGWSSGRLFPFVDGCL